MGWTISRTYEFAAAHRLEGHPKCGRIHGHNYLVELFIISDHLPKEKWLMDYAQVDAAFKPIINELDHRYIASHENVGVDDPYYLMAKDRNECVELDIARSTAECIAKWLHEQFCNTLELMGLVYNVRVVVRESSKSSATYE